MPSTIRIANTIDRAGAPIDAIRGTPGLVAYYDADNMASLWQNIGMSTPTDNIDLSPIGRWNDLNGSSQFYDLTVLGADNNNRARLRTGANGVNGYNAVDFYGALVADSCLVNLSFNQTVSAYTVMFTGIVYETNPDAVSFTLQKTGTNPWQGTDGILVKTLGVSTDYFIDGGEDQGNPLFIDNTISNSAPMLMTIQVSNSAATATRTGKVWVNGGSPNTDTGTGPLGNMALNYLTIGDWSGGGAPCRQKIRHWAVYNRALSTSELTSVGLCMAQKSQISITRFS